MLRTLLESRSESTRNGFATTGSVTIHFVLILLAAFVTAASAPPEHEHESPTMLHWVTPRHLASGPVARSITRASADASEPVRLPSSSLAISTNIPDVNIPLGAVRHDEFAAGLSSATDSGSSVLGNSGVAKPAYDAYEVDRRVEPLSGVGPVYPAAMRFAGIEGEVEAQFIVSEHGGAEISSLRIVKSTNDQFAESVRRALPKMRFVPAQLGGRPVAQTVQQLFSFRLNR